MTIYTETYSLAAGVLLLFHACRFFLYFVNCKNDYRSMRIITDDLYARLVRHFLKDEKVALFQDLVMSETVKESESDTQEDNTGGDNEHDE